MENEEIKWILVIGFVSSFGSAENGFKKFTLLNMIGLKEQQIVFNMGKVRDVSLDAKLYYEFSFSPIVLSSKKRVMVV